MEDLSSRIEILEARRHVERVRMDSAAAFDDVAQKDVSLRRILNSVTPEYRFSSNLGVQIVGTDELSRQVAAYRRRLSFAMTFMTGGVTEMDSDTGTAAGEWVLWQPFSRNGEAWMMAGRTNDTFRRDEGQWRLSSSHLKVEILSPWRQSWADHRIVTPRR